MSKPNLETIISDLQPKLQALEPLEIASEYAKILAERNELKTEIDPQLIRALLAVCVYKFFTKRLALCTVYAGVGR